MFRSLVGAIIIFKIRLNAIKSVFLTYNYFYYNHVNYKERGNFHGLFFCTRDFLMSEIETLQNYYNYDLTNYMLDIISINVNDQQICISNIVYLKKNINNLLFFSFLQIFFGQSICSFFRVKIQEFYWRIRNICIQQLTIL